MSNDLDDQFDDDARPNRDRFREARSRVSLPATLMIVVGALSLLYAILELVQRGSIPGQLDQQIAIVEADPNMTRDQKDFQINILNSFKDVMQQPISLVFYVVNLVCSLLVLIGGIRMMQLSGPALPTVSAILAMIPCTVGCCCFLGLPVGIWVLVALHNPHVRAAMAARNASPQYTDDQEMR